MYQAILMHTHIAESTKIGDIRNDTGQDHTHLQVIDRMHRLIEVKLLQLRAWVTAGLLQLVQDIR